MNVHVVGDDPVRDAVVDALMDVDIGIEDATVEDLEDARFAIVSDVTGAQTFRIANGFARAGRTPWIAVEIGGIGGRPIDEVEASVSGFSSDTGCFDCLYDRVASTTTERPDSPSASRATARLAGAIAGRECVRILSGEERTILGSTIELPHARRRFLPVPGCACQTGDRDRILELTDDESRPLEEAVEHAELAIDQRVGLVTSIGEIESFPAPYYLATSANTSGFSEANAPSKSAGVDADWNAALMKAVGESLERYCAAVYQDDDFVHERVDELESAISPTTFVRPDDAAPFDPDDEHLWVQGVNLETGDPAYVPADAVHFPQPGPSFVPQITTGLGLGSSTADAISSGLTEVLERDATMLAWYSTYEPLGLQVTDDVYETLERRARGEGLTVTALLLTQDVDVPVVAVTVHRDDADDWPAFAVGSAADLDAVAAARSALAEALQNWMELRSLGPEESAEAGAWIGDYGSFPDAARTFVEPPRTIEASVVGPDPVPTGTQAVAELVDRTVAADLPPYAVRLTTRDVESLGFEAVRVVVPGAQPLFTDEPYFGTRARSVPEDLGFEPRLDREPHPYP